MRNAVSRNLWSLRVVPMLKTVQLLGGAGPSFLKSTLTVAGKDRIPSAA